MWTGPGEGLQTGPKNIKKHDLRQRLVYNQSGASRRMPNAAEMLA
jgi:hypothetical protein